MFLGSVGWYRLRFTGPATPAGLGWALRFEAVRRVARVWLNGRRTGRRHEIEIWFGVVDDTMYLVSGNGRPPTGTATCQADPVVTVRLDDDAPPGQARVVRTPTSADASAT